MGAPLNPQSILTFLDGHEQMKTRSAATGSSYYVHSQPSTEAPDDVPPEDVHSHRSRTHASSVRSGVTRRSSVFDPTGDSSSTTSVLPGRPPLLPCEFHWHGHNGHGHCEETFDLNNIHGWVRHMETEHLDMELPMSSRCWFCDDIEFRSESASSDDRRVAYTRRMHHNADHFRQGWTTAQVRPDFDFLDHLDQHGLISGREFRYARDFHEAPQPRNGIHSVPSASRRGTEVVVEVRQRRGGRRESRRGYYP